MKKNEQKIVEEIKKKRPVTLAEKLLSHENLQERGLQDLEIKSFKDEKYFITSVPKDFHSEKG